MTDPVHPDQPYTPSTDDVRDEMNRRDAIKTTREQRTEAGAAVKGALRSCGIGLRVYGNELLDVGDVLLRSKWLAEHDASVRREAQAEQRESDYEMPNRKGVMIELVRLNEQSRDIGDMSDGLIAYFAAAIRRTESEDNRG